MSNKLNKWDQRYSEPGYAYGTDPNDFLVDSIERLPAGGKVLCLADGEGRNSVYLARNGFEVTAIDASTVGVKKKRQLAKEHGVKVEAIVADLADSTIDSDCYDAINSIFCHLPLPLRKKVHKSVAKSLRKEGIFLLEGYAPKQLENNTGGPRIPELLMELKDVTEEITPLRLIHSIEKDRDIKEGKLHTGIGSIVQVIAKKEF